MWRRVAWLLPALTAAACTGLYLENANAYPCDYAAGPGARDEVCLAGDVCRTNNVCGKFIYEGPRFEGTATLPVFGPESGEGALLHPLVLSEAGDQVSADLPLSRGTTGYVRAGTSIFIVRAGHVLATNPAFPSQLPPLFGAPLAPQTFFEGVSPVPNVLIASDTGKFAVGELGSTATDLVRVDPLTPFLGTGFRVIEQAPLLGSPRARPIAWNQAELGVVEKQGTGWAFTSWISNPGEVLDVAGLTLPGRLWVFALLPDSVEVIDAADGGVALAASMDPFTVESGRLKTDQSTRVIAATRRGSLLPVGSPLDVLSTFQVNITADGPTLTSPWPDCVPCDEGEHVELTAPSVRSGAPTVDVVCMRALGLPRPLRVVGSVALTQLDSCLTEELEVSLSLARVAGLPGRIVHWDSQSGLLISGRNGELWSGETLDSLAPEFLDRVPLDVAPANAGLTPSLAVIADDYLAIQQTPENQLPFERLNGFRRVPNRELGASESTRLLGFVHGVDGWAVANGGVVVRVRVNLGVSRIDPGPQLVTASEDPIRDSIGGEAFTKADGGLAFFLAADDSLYFLQDAEDSLDPLNDGALMSPDLTPEPSVPIRSLALERTPLGTDGEDRARGYLVTSRNVYAWQLGGEPPRWSSTLLEVTGGEPVEVWFDSPRSALGRVGYRDGQIFSLPGGYQLAEALPAGPDGVPPLVLDFENLGGWPVAYANTGLFVAGWDQVDGKLQNRFPSGVNRPMTWREVKLAGGATPWMRRLPDGGVPRIPLTKPGKLFVAVDPRVEAGQPDGGLQAHRLMLFNDDEVRQVARHLRK